MTRVRFVSLVLGSTFILLGAGGATSLYAQEIPSHSVGVIPTGELAPDVSRAVVTAIRGPDGEGKDGPMAKVGMELAVLYHQHESLGTGGVRRLREAVEDRQRKTSTDLQMTESRIASPISADGRFVMVDAVAAEEPSQLLQDLRRLGLRGGTRAGRLVSGHIPISALKSVSQLSSLNGMMTSFMRVEAGSVESEADTAHSVVDVRQELGLSGESKKICVLSDSYDQEDQARTTAADDIQSGNLPGSNNPDGNTTPVDVLDDSDSEGTDEGRAMLQLIHDLVPKAKLGFHTASGGVAAFANAVRQLGDPTQGDCDVIVDDIRYNVEPFYQDGPVSNAADDVVNNDGVPFFSSAGNDGQNTYEAPFRNSGASGIINSSSVLHDFDKSSLSQDTRQAVTVESGGTFRIFTLQWTDPSSIVSGSAGADTDIDVGLVDGNGDVVAQSASDNVSSGIPVEGVLEYTNETGSTQTLDLFIEKAAGPDPDQVKYIYSGSGSQVDEYDTLGPTIYGHPMADGAMAVAAAPFYNTSAYNSNADPAALESFSSKGGIQIRFDQDGNELGTYEQRQKPEVTGTDGIDNTFFGNDIDDTFFSGVDADPHPNFFGTSASAPNVAAIAALIRQARSALSPVEVYDRLTSTADDVTTRLRRDGTFVDIKSGVDPWSGHGFVRGQQAVPEPTGVQIASLSSIVSSISERDGTVQLGWRKVGQAGVDAFLLEKRFFDGDFTEVRRVSADGGRDYAETIEDLPAGEHTFRISALRNDSTLAVASMTQIIGGDDVKILAYPNPFEEAVNLSVTLASDGNGEEVRVEVFDALGRQIAVPTNGRQITSSESITLDANQIGMFGPGVYFVRVDGDSFLKTVKVVRVQ